MNRLCYITVSLAAIAGLLVSVYHFIVNDQSIVLSGYFQTSLLFIVIATLIYKAKPVKK